MALPFLGQPNDIAVTVDSIKSVNQEGFPQPQIQEVGCDHLTYFRHPEGLKALTRALIQAQQKTEIFADEFSVPAPPSILNQTLVNNSTTTTKSKWLLGTIASLLSLITIIGWFFWQKSHQTEPLNGQEADQALVTAKNINIVSASIAIIKLDE